MLLSLQESNILIQYYNLAVFIVILVYFHSITYYWYIRIKIMSKKFFYDLNVAIVYVYIYISVVGSSLGMRQLL